MLVWRQQQSIRRTICRSRRNSTDHPLPLLRIRNNSKAGVAGEKHLNLFGVLFGQHRTGIIDQSPARLHQRCAARQDLALLINPHNESDLAEAILKVVMDESCREELRRLGPAHAGRFTWLAAAEKTLEVYSKVATTSFNRFFSETGGPPSP